jgi:hypothetical protein
MIHLQKYKLMYCFLTESSWQTETGFPLLFFNIKSNSRSDKDALFILFYYVTSSQRYALSFIFCQRF